MKNLFWGAGVWPPWIPRCNTNYVYVICPYYSSNHGRCKSRNSKKLHLCSQVIKVRNVQMLTVAGLTIFLLCIIDPLFSIMNCKLLGKDICGPILRYASQVRRAVSKKKPSVSLETIPVKFILMMSYYLYLKLGIPLYAQNIRNRNFNLVRRNSQEENMFRSCLMLSTMPKETQKTFDLSGIIFLLINFSL